MARYDGVVDDGENKRHILTTDIEGQMYSKGSNFLWLAAMLGQATLITLDSVFARFSMKGVST